MSDRTRIPTDQRQEVAAAVFKLVIRPVFWLGAAMCVATVMWLVTRAFVPS